MVQLSLVAATAALLVFLSTAEAHPGGSYIHRLSVTQDVTLERGSRNFNYLRYLIVGTHPNYPLKRSLLQFENVPYSCRNIRWAKLYIYYAYSHKASFLSEAQVPFVSRPLQVHQVKKQWSESQATSTYRLSNQPWSQPWLALDGTDADPEGLPSEPVTISPSSHSGFIALDITKAVRNWKNGAPNYGLVLLATNEATLGRDTRFVSNADGNSARHAYIDVLCYQPVYQPVFPPSLGPIHDAGLNPIDDTGLNPR
jgi:hypothetical protein